MSTDMSQFLQTFYEESFEGLEIMESGLLDLDTGDADVEIVNGIFRAAHSIKGGSATFGLDGIAAFTHVLETLLDQLREGTRPVTREIVDLLLASVDVLKDMLVASRDGTGFDEARATSLQGRMTELLENDAGAPAPAERSASGPGGGWRVSFRPHADIYLTGNDPVRILRELAELGDAEVSADVEALPALADLDPESSYLAWDVSLRGTVDRAALDDVFCWVEDECDLAVTPLTGAGGTLSVHDARQEAESEQGVSGELVVERRKGGDRRRGERRQGAGAGDSSSIRVNIDKIDAVINLVGELVITQSMLSTVGEDFDITRLEDLKAGLAHLERNTRELQDSVMRMRMLPISFVFNRFPRLVHDISQKLGKQVELRMSGEGTELDKTLVERITDPLVHLVRNAMDHGIEEPAEREAAGKPPAGTIHLNAYHKGGNIVIEISDDGRGLNRDRILAKAIDAGLVTAADDLSDDQIHDLVFMPGFSTADAVSDLSGRGVGMDVVRRNITSLGGSVAIRSTPGQGSCITVRLPLTVAILEGQSVAVGDEVYIVPLVSIIESIQVRTGMINRVAGRGEVFALRGEYLPVIRLTRLFGASRPDGADPEGLLVIVEGEGLRAGLLVDDLLGQQQFVIKSLEANYRRVEGIAGATILGDGSVALIVDVPGAIRLANTGGNGNEYRKRA